MLWYKVTFDLDRDQPPGIEPQIAVAVRVQEAYRALGYPEGFAVYDLADYERMLYSFFFSSLAAQHFAEFIKCNRSEIWDEPLPNGANLTIGDPAVTP
jgi:hypothetical protein